MTLPIAVVSQFPGSDTSVSTTCARRMKAPLDGSFLIRGLHTRRR